MALVMWTLCSLPIQTAIIVIKIKCQATNHQEAKGPRQRHSGKVLTITVRRMAFIRGPAPLCRFTGTLPGLKNKRINVTIFHHQAQVSRFFSGLTSLQTSTQIKISRDKILFCSKHQSSREDLCANLHNILTQNCWYVLNQETLKNL